MVYLLFTRRFLNICRDVVFAYLYIKTIPSNKRLTPRSKALSALCLLLLFVMTGVDDSTLFASGSVRFLLRSACFFLYIYQIKKISLPTMIYDALLINTVCVVNHNLFLTSVTRPFLNASVSLSGFPVVNEFLCFMIVNIVSILIYCFVYHFIPLREIKNVGKSRIIILLLLAIESQYLNNTLKIITGLQPELSVQLSIYVILLQLALLLCLAFIEHYQIAVHEQAHTQLENQAAHALLESIRAQQKNDSIIQQMRHDLKNHLISIRYLINHQKEGEAVEYIDQLVSDDALTQTHIRTGNSILDGILIQKTTIAEQNNIAVSISADFTYIRSINGADLCIIFGNLLDNAIEACQKVESSSRYINIRGHLIGEAIIYTIENSSSGTVTLEHHMPLTTKKDSQNHGIGLISVERIVLKNQGSIAFSPDKNKFTVILTFPVFREETQT